MANEKHLRILKKGVETWNRWRERNGDIEPDLHGVSLIGADLGGADLSRADLSLADLSWTTLTGANLILANIRGANLSEANLGEAIIIQGSLREANLREANLTASDFRGADLSNATLRGARLRGAILNATTLSGADLTDAILISTILGDVDLSAVKGLENVRHAGPSIIGIDTIYSSKGRIPEIFLRGAGVPEPFIANMKSLVAAMSPIEFYSCFISYSSKDQDFADRLYADLQAKGVRCWFAPEDLKIGDPFRQRIDEAIRRYDKLLVVLSGTSVASTWVESEVEAALERERNGAGTVLFPIRLDEAGMKTGQAWAACICRKRHMGDLNQMANPKSCQQTL